MFTAHYAPALVAAALPRAPRLAALFVAAQLCDIALALLALAGVEHDAIEPFYTAISPLALYDVPWSHSLLGTLGLAAAFAVAVRLAGGGKDGAWIGAGVVASHWLLDLVARAPDLTLAGGGRRYGLGLSNHPYLAMPLELGLVFVALTFYAGRTRAPDWRGRVALVLLAAALTGFQLAAWLAPRPTTAIDPAPPSTAPTMLAIFTVLTVLAWWTDALREACPARPALAPSASRTGEGR